MEKITIRLPRLTEDIYIGTGIITNAAPIIGTFGYDGYLVVIDHGAYESHREYFDGFFSQLSIDRNRIIKLTPTHGAKDFNTVRKILHRLTALRATRRSCILSIGGGYIGDVSGFAASIYMRGIDFVQIPTTFMAQADAVVGKVAINFESMKNQLGSFYSPRLVFSDTSFLGNLKFKEIAYGLVEVWKHALLLKDLSIIASIEKILSSREHLIDYKPLIRFSIEAKGRFVEQDPEDMYGQHKALSLGHTLANVLETKLQLRHGAAVYYGLLFESLLANKMSKINSENLSALLKTAQLFEQEFKNLSRVKYFLRRKKLTRALVGDKINSHGRYTFVIPSDVGYEIVKDLDAIAVESTVEALLNFTFNEN